MKAELLATLSATHITQKSGDICLVANSPLTPPPFARGGVRKLSLVAPSSSLTIYGENYV